MTAFICCAMLISWPLSILAQQVKIGAESKESKNVNNTKKSSPRTVNVGKVPEQVKKQIPADDIKGETFRGDPGITETVEEIMERERNTPKPLFDPSVVEEKPEHVPFRPNKIQPPGVINIPRFPYDPNDDDSLLNDFLPQTVGTSIAGPGRVADGIGAVPPDSIGDVGPTQVLMHANGRIKVYDKFTGAVGGLDALDTTFWISVRNGIGISDPRVEYDRLSGRWILCMINTSATLNRLLIAVSSGPTITNTTSFTFFQFATATQFLDYPTLGADANAVYIGGNIFTSSSGSFASTRGYVINKADLLSGTLTFTTFNSIGTAAAGPYTPQGVSNDDATFTEGYFIGVDTAAYSLLQMRRVSTPGGTPTISANIPLIVSTTTAAISQEHQGRNVLTATRFLDSLDDRLFQAQITRDNITGISNLWTSHNFEVGINGTAQTGGGRNGSRWYEIENLTTVPTVRQSGTLFDNAAATPNGYWIPSTAVSGQGHMSTGASSAGVSRFAELWSAGRLRTDTLGTIQAPSQIQASSTAYNLQTAATQRWGDYSKTTVDPCDNQSMWHVGEYCDLVNSWRMRAVRLIAPGPPATVTPAPSMIGSGMASVNVVATGASVAGTEFYDNPVGYICNASCSTTGTGTCHIAAVVTASPPLTPEAALTINSITFDSPTQVTLNISTVGATPGTHTIQIRNPDGQATTFDFNVLAPTAATVPLGGRIINTRGQPVRGVNVSLLDSDTGSSLTVATNNKGEYVHPENVVGQTYVATPSFEGYTFEPQSRIIQLNDQTLDVDFVASSVVPQQAVFNDFDGDGRTDPAIFRSGERNWYIWQSETETMRVENWGLPTDLLTPADFDGDGKTDVAVFRPSNGTWYIRNSRNGDLTIRQFGTNKDYPVAGDFDGDGRADLAVYRAKEGSWYILQSSNNEDRVVSWGNSSDQPLPYDFDGDGKVDPTVYRQGVWYSLMSANGDQKTISFGLDSDKIAPADYDGDGKTDIAVYRPSSGTWFILQSTDSSAMVQFFGLENDQVASGDYDGDGRSDIALYRNSNSVWYARRTDGGFFEQQWGLPGDVPAVPSYLR